MALDPHEMELDIDGDRITLRRLLEAAGHLLDLLGEVDKEITERPRPSLDWVITGLKKASAHLALSPQAVGEKSPVWARDRVLSVVTEGFAQIQAGGPRPEYFNDNALFHAREIATIAKKKGIRYVSIRARGSRIRMDASLATQVDGLLEGKEEAWGSVEGTLEAINIHGRSYFNVYDDLTGRAVKCYFPTHLLTTVHAALGRRVSVSGRLLVQPNGDRSSVQVQQLDVFPVTNELPSFEDALGILTNA